MQRSRAFRFVLIMSIVSLFADMTYEGARSVTGPFLAALGASGFVVGTIAGFSELAGFGLRYVSGVISDRSGRYWAVTFVGYIINLLAVPALAFAHSWPPATGLIVAERVGRGIRKPSSNAMMSYAGSQLGQGWVFGFREAMDQTGATIGPLVVALILWMHGGFSGAFAVLFIPAALAIVALVIGRIEFPVPREMERSAASKADPAKASQLQRAFWFYAAAGACLAAGFADYALVSYHLSRAHIVSNALIPILYACAMLVAAAFSPYFGRLYDRYGPGVVMAAFGASALFAPLVFFGGFGVAIAGILLWGLGMGAQDALLPPVIAGLVPPERRATALGTFDGVYGVAWFAGSAAMGALYDTNLVWLVVFSLVTQLGLGIPLLWLAARAQRGGATPSRAA